jgi:hypothetical protein
LGVGVAVAEKNISKWDAGVLREMPREECGLVKLALAESPRMEGDRDYAIERLASKTWVIKSCCEKFSKAFRNPEFSVVFYTVNEVPDNSAAAYDRDSALEVEGCSPAIRAIEIRSETGKRLRAGLAAWWFDKFDRRIAFTAKVFSLANPRGAARTVGGEKERQERAKNGAAQHSSNKSTPVRK